LRNTVAIAGLGAIGLELARALDAGVEGVRLSRAMRWKRHEAGEANLSIGQLTPLSLSLVACRHGLVSTLKVGS
jgi:aspartate dehydrogenase